MRLKTVFDVLAPRFGLPAGMFMDFSDETLAEDPLSRLLYSVVRALRPFHAVMCSTRDRNATIRSISETSPCSFHILEALSRNERGYLTHLVDTEGLADLEPAEVVFDAGAGSDLDLIAKVLQPRLIVSQVHEIADSDPLQFELQPGCKISCTVVLAHERAGHSGSWRR